MLRPLIALSCVVAIAPALAAQEKPTPAAQQAMAGQWQFDQSRSDTVAGDPLQGVTGHSAISGGAADASHTGGASGVSSGGGGGGSKGKGGGGGGAAAVFPASTPGGTAGSGAPAGGGGGRSHDPHLAVVLDDADPGAGLVIAANDSVVSMVTANQLKAGGRTDWRTDGKKHQDAQMDGSIIEQLAMWSDGDLTTVKTVAGIGTLKREFKVSKDGKTLEVKEHIEAGGRKTDKKLVFTRKQ